MTETMLDFDSLYKSFFKGCIWHIRQRVNRNDKSKDQQYHGQMKMAKMTNNGLLKTSQKTKD